MKPPNSSKSKPRTGSLRAMKVEKTAGSASSFRSNRYGKGKVGDSGKYTGESGIFAPKVTKKAQGSQNKGTSATAGRAADAKRMASPTSRVTKHPKGHKSGSAPYVRPEGSSSSLRAKGIEKTSGSASSLRSQEKGKPIKGRTSATGSIRAGVKAPAGLPSSLRAKGMEKTSASASSLRSQEKGKPVATRSSATSSIRAGVKAPAGSSRSLRAQGMAERYGKYGAKKPKGY